MRHYGSKSRSAKAHPIDPANFAPAFETGERLISLHFPHHAIFFSFPLKFHHRAPVAADVANVISKNSAPKNAVKRPPKRDRQALHSPQTIISKQLCSQEEQKQDDAKLISKNSTPQNKVGHPHKSDCQVFRSPKTIAKPLCMQEELQSGGSADETSKCSDDGSSSASKIKNISADSLTAPSASVSKVLSAEAFHTGSNIIQKLESSAKAKLCIVPVLKTQSGSETPRCGLELSKINGQRTPSNAALIPAPSILMPAQLLSQFAAAPNSRQTQAQTRSIGVQVELQPIIDIKLM